MATREKDAQSVAEWLKRDRRVISSNDSIMKKERIRRSWNRRLRYFYLRFVRMRGSSKEISRGLAAGVFAGLFPLFGFQTIIGVALAALLKGNKIIAAAGTWISNPLTYVPIYALNYQVGRWLLGPSQINYTFSDFQSVKDLMERGADMTIALFVGCFVMGLMCSIGSYFLGLKLVHYARRQRRKFRYRFNIPQKKWDR